MQFPVEAICGFVNRHPTVKMLALSFLLLIGASLVAEGFDAGLPKGYVHGPIAFAILVELLNLRYEPLHLRPVYVKSGDPGDLLLSRRAASHRGVDGNGVEAGTPGE
ncbi:MAG: hypothetical protein ACT4O0_03395 [Pseudonocardia sp.]|jgi:hypothetical protein